MSLTIFFAFQIIDNYTAGSFQYDSAIFMNVADNLRKGNGYSLNLIFPVTTFDIDTKVYRDNTNVENIIKEYPKKSSPYSKAPIRKPNCASASSFVNPSRSKFFCCNSLS